MKKKRLMRNELDTNRVQEILTLHNEIGGYLKMSLEKAIRIGELLTEQKASLKHGEWLPWIESNLSFTDRTARNYMWCYREKDRLKTETVSDLKGAYLLISDLDESRDLTPAWVDKELKRLKEQSDKLMEVDIEKATDISMLNELSKQALELQNEYAELRIRLARKIGKCLNDLDRLMPGNDWIGLINDEVSWQKMKGFIEKRIHELSI